MTAGVTQYIFPSDLTEVSVARRSDHGGGSSTVRAEVVPCLPAAAVAAAVAATVPGIRGGEARGYMVSNYGSNGSIVPPI